MECNSSAALPFERTACTARATQAFSTSQCSHECNKLQKMTRKAASVPSPESPSMVTGYAVRHLEVGGDSTTISRTREDVQKEIRRSPMATRREPQQRGPCCYSNFRHPLAPPWLATCRPAQAGA